MPDVLNGVVNVVLLLAILVVLVVIHEFGHFVTARLANVRVHEFGIGFPPRARILARDSETIYTLNWLPIGGFVRLEGEEGESQDPRSFVRQPLRTRLVILVAGVAMNFLLAWLILSLIAGLADPIAGIRVGQVQPGSPAERIGLRGGRVISTDPLRIDTSSADTIVAVDEKSFPFFDDPAASLDYLRSRAGETVSLRVRHADGSVEDLQTTLRRPEELGPDRGALGIRYLDPVPVGEIRRDPVTAISVGWSRTIQASTLILRALGELVTNLAQPPVAGPIGIAQAVGTVRQEFPPIFLLYLVALLSANLAVVNILPFPPMDGGRIAVSLVQAVTGNRISVALERAVYLTGFVLLMALIVWISYFDIQRLGTPGT